MRGGAGPRGRAARERQRWDVTQPGGPEPWLSLSWCTLTANKLSPLLLPCSHPHRRPTGASARHRRAVPAGRWPMLGVCLSTLPSAGWVPLNLSEPELSPLSNKNNDAYLIGWRGR